MLKNNKLTGFTFVELMVSIVILIILASIGFVSYTSHLSDARNAERVSNMTNIYDLFQLYKSKNSLPLPDLKLDLSYSGQLLSYQGYLSAGILESVGAKSYLGRDPKVNDYYTYHISKNGKYFQFMGFLEDSTTKKLAIVGDTLGTVTNKNSLVPIQDLFIGGVDFHTLTGIYMLNVSDTTKIYGDNDTLGAKLKIMAETGKNP